VAVFETEKMLRRLPMFSRQLTRALPATLLALATVPFLITGDIVNRAATHADACARLPVTRELADWLRVHTPDPAPLAGALPTYSVMSPWSIGHHIRIIGQRPVVVDPFNYAAEHQADDALGLVWRAKTADELMKALRRYNARYLVLTNVAEEIVSTLRSTGARKDDFVRVTPGGTLVFLPAMSQFASFRLFVSSGMSGEFGSLQPRYFTADSERYTVGPGRWGGAHQVVVPAGQIYEVKPGALLTGYGPGVDAVRVGFTLRRHEEQPVQVEGPLATGPDRGFEFHTALPAPVAEEGFRVEGGYTFTTGDYTAIVQVTQAMVDTQAVITVEWPSEP
jgi:hypothetical protein